LSEFLPYKRKDEENCRGQQYIDRLKRYCEDDANRRVFFDFPSLADRADSKHPPKERDLPRSFGGLGADV